MVRLGQAEAAHPLARRQLGQVLLALCLVSVGVDRIHHERRLDRQSRPVARVYAVHFPRYQAVGDIAEAGSAVFLRDRRAEEAERAHFLEDVPVELLIAIGFNDVREQLFLAEVMRGVAHHPLFRGQFRLDIERIFPLERRFTGGRLLADFGHLRHLLALQCIPPRRGV